MKCDLNIDTLRTIVGSIFNFSSSNSTQSYTKVWFGCTIELICWMDLGRFFGGPCSSLPPSLGEREKFMGKNIEWERVRKEGFGKAISLLPIRPFTIRLTKSGDNVQNIYTSAYILDSSSDDDVSPRENLQKNTAGASDFCVKRISQHAYGRREIEVNTYDNILIDI